MAELLSVGLDVGTTSTQLVVSRLTVENRASPFAVPDMKIVGREILYESPVHLTPLGQGQLVDGRALRLLLEQEYRRAGIRPEQVDTGAVIVTGETSRKENAEAVARSLSELAGRFVVTTAGPDLESILAARGAGAVELSRQVREPVLHMDIGGGTSNLALLRDGKVLRTGCMDVGGRLVKLDKDGTLTYVSPVLEGLFPLAPGDRPGDAALWELARKLSMALEVCAGLREAPELERLYTREASRWVPPGERVRISFSGGVAECIRRDHPPLSFGDLGPLLGRAVRESRLCRGDHSFGTQTIRATVIGAGCYSTRLSGSTVFCRNVALPLKDLPVVREGEPALHEGGSVMRAVTASPSPSYSQIRELADRLAGERQGPMYLCMEEDMGKALGQALAARLPEGTPILCLDGIRTEPDSFLDVGLPVGPAFPVVVKTLVFER